VAEALALMGGLGGVRAAVVDLAGDDGDGDPSVWATHPDGALSNAEHDDETDLRGESIDLVRARFEGHPGGSPESDTWRIVPWRVGGSTGAVLVSRDGPNADRIADWAEGALSSGSAEREAVEALAGGLVVASPDGTIEAVTAGAAALLGKAAAELVGAQLDALCGDRVATDLAAIEPSEVLRLPLFGAGGRALHGRAERNPEGRVVLRLETAEDHAPHALERDQLVAAIRHEIRTPLTVLRGVTSMLEEEPEMELEDRVGFLASLKKETNRVITLVEDILTAARMDAGRELTRLQAVDLVVVASELVTEVRPFCERSGVTLHVEITHDPLIIEADRQLLEQLTRSVMGHVLRAAPRGLQVWIRADRTDDIARLEIVDDGPANEEHVFTSFRRSTASGKYAPGVGVGLAVAKRIANAHGWGLGHARSDAGNHLVLRAPIDDSKL